MEGVRRTGSAALLAGVMVLSACGSDGASVNKPVEGAGTAKGEIDPCSYISAQEVSAITTDKVSRAAASEATCTYHAEPDDGVQVTIHAGDGVKRMEVARKTLQLLGGMGKAVAGKGGAGADTEALLRKDRHAAPALGDEAVWGPNAMLAVRKGDFFVEVTPPIMHDPANHSGYPLVSAEERRKIAQAVAEKVLAAANLSTPPSRKRSGE